ncbi:MAG: hypothetical protein CVU72_00815 [Deltaproteobacteria bacterium HGW-Deltaproteobacteria-7]|jgi:hypothetical protein|nr:MAG: hypothetical protein CVU72_00815 [Deltaproteobacteria bacterium HGW-Deltaproteobacteria-7]PKN18617.1 MAG: hypothetical protein CVU71_14155 [Deltaproteobacteria bacterium HGW-Deltaproteobacteria-6]
MQARLDKLDIDDFDDFDEQASREGKYLIYALAGEKHGFRILRAKEVIRVMMTIPVEQDGFKGF